MPPVADYCRQLSRAEEAEAWAALAAGCPKARAALIESYAPAARWMASRLFARIEWPGGRVGEAVSAGFVGLINAVDRFSPARGVKFLTYAQRVIRGAVLDERRGYQGKSRPTFVGPAGLRDAADPAGGVGAEAAARRGDVRDLVFGRLRPRERAVFQAHFYDGETLKAAAARVGLHPDSVRNDLTLRTMPRLRKALAGREDEFVI